MFRDGFLTEGSSSNVFVVKNGVILAPPKNNLVLPGITYDVVLELAQANGLPLEVRPDLGSGSARRRRDLGHLVDQGSARGDDARRKAVGGGKPGAVFRRMHQLYQEFKRTVMRQAA